MHRRIPQLIYELLFMPKAATEDDRRQEFILDILLVGTAGLSLLATLVTIYNSITLGAAYMGAPPVILLVVYLIFLILLIISRRGFYRFVSYTFVSVFFLATTYPMLAADMATPQELLVYSLVLVMTGVLIGSRAAFVMTALISAGILLRMYLNQVGVLRVNPALLAQRDGYGDEIVYALTFGLIALVSWLANRDISHSLHRARASEAALMRERDTLELKVRERTRALEAAQMEKALQMRRFAEFGRLSATLLHDLASPLTAVSLGLEQLDAPKNSNLLKAARQGAASMEQYVIAARRQLQNQSEAADFSPADEITRIMPLLKTRAKVVGVTIHLDLASELTLHGSSAQFNQVTSNLVTNAIDAYDGVDSPSRKKTITVSLKPKGKRAQLTVHDCGVGILPSKLPHVFDTFYTSKYTPENLGLGLSIVKQIVEEEFCGTITAASSKRSGTRFIVTLPSQESAS